MTPAQLALRRAEARLVERLAKLEAGLDAGDEAAWRAYAEAAVALALILPQTVPGANGQFLSTKEMAAALNVSTKTVLRRRKAGELTAVELGRRGRAALRWRGDGAVR